MKKILMILGGITWILLCMGISVSGTNVLPVRVGFIDTGVSCLYLDETKVLEGKNYVFPEQDTEDRVGHGTATAGILLGSEEMGIAGMAEQAEIIPLVIYDRYPSGVVQNGGVEAICAAIYDAVDLFGCRIINISMGVPEAYESLQEAVRYAEEKGVVIVSAVGNVHDTDPGLVYYPAAYSTVIGVGAADGEQTAAFSQRNGVFVLSSGVDIPCVTIRNSGETEYRSGTSYACAMVTAFCCQVLAEDASVTPAELRQLISVTAKDLGASGKDEDTGWGLLVPGMAEQVSQPFTRAYAAEMLKKLLQLPDSDELYYRDTIGHPCQNAISACTEAGIFIGTGKQNFMPDVNMSMQMLAIALDRIAGSPAAAEIHPGDLPEPLTEEKDVTPIDLIRSLDLRNIYPENAEDTAEEIRRFIKNDESP